MTTSMKPSLRAAVAVSALLALSACGDGFGLSNPFGGAGDASRAQAEASRRAPDARGIISYDTYQVAVAREGDDLASIASRIGLSTAELANHNGLPLTYRPRPGEVMALPRQVAAAPAGAVPGTPEPAWTPDVAVSAIDSADPVVTSLPAAGAATRPFSRGQADEVVQPQRHRVVRGETAYSVARKYGVSITELASWNALDKDLTIRIDQELLIPTNGSVPPARSVPNSPGTASALPAPPSARRPLPEEDEVASIEKPESPALDQYRTPPGASSKLLKPVSGSILRPYSTAPGAGKNEGIDIAAAAGTPVKAAEAGEVALVSESLGGLGTIVLIRHPDALMTVYGRVSGVSLKKGDTVKRGQKIGVIADGDTPNLHFEVRRGTQAVDPTPYL